MTPDPDEKLLDRMIACGKLFLLLVLVFWMPAVFSLGKGYKAIIWDRRDIWTDLPYAFLAAAFLIIIGFQLLPPLAEWFKDSRAKLHDKTRSWKARKEVANRKQ